MSIKAFGKRGEVYMPCSAGCGNLVGKSQVDKCSGHAICPPCGESFDAFEPWVDLDAPKGQSRDRYVDAESTPTNGR